jgi:hypothetical protein
VHTSCKLSRTSIRLLGDVEGRRAEIIHAASNGSFEEGGQKLDGCKCFEELSNRCANTLLVLVSCVSVDGLTSPNPSNAISRSLAAFSTVSVQESAAVTPSLCRRTLMQYRCKASVWSCCSVRKPFLL